MFTIPLTPLTPNSHGIGSTIRIVPTLQTASVCRVYPNPARFSHGETDGGGPRVVSGLE